MQCTSPKRFFYSPVLKKLIFKNPYNNIGQQITFIKGFDPISLPCQKCTACKLEKAREIAIRCMHEVESLDGKDCHFLTLTYSDENVGNNILDYTHIQKFIRALRKKQNGRKIKYLAAGEYGEKNGRMHWHLLLFNVHLSDLLQFKKTERGDPIFKSELVDKLWGRNDAEQAPSNLGQITLESAGYVARYTLKKTGNEKTFARRSTRNPIGKNWLERNYEDILNTGVISIGAHCGNKLTTTTIPRWYREWFAKNKTVEWNHYLNTTQAERIKVASQFDIKERDEYVKQNLKRAQKKGLLKRVANKLQARKIILDQKFKKLKDAQKL